MANSILNMFGKMKEDDMSLTFRSKNFAFEVDGDGVGGKISPEGIDQVYNWCKTKAEQKACISAKEAIENTVDSCEKKINNEEESDELDIDNDFIIDN